MKAILVIDVPEDMRVEDTRALHLTLFNGLFTKDISLGYYVKPMPEKYIEREIKIETERDVEVCTHGITLGRNLLIEELEK